MESRISNALNQMTSPFEKGGLREIFLVWAPEIPPGPPFSKGEIALSCFVVLAKHGN